MTATWTGHAWSCTVRLVVTDRDALRPAAEDLRALLDRVDAAASRFRADSALSVANRRAGRPTPIPLLLVELVDAALDAAAQTDGAVDPTLGRTLQRLGYDRDIAAVRDQDSAATARPVGTAWQRIRLERSAGLLTVPVGVALDLGATAKAWTADAAAQSLATRYRTGVLVELGGDVAVAGPAPDGGWRLRVAEREGGDGQLVTLHNGGLTTSTTTIRTWRRGTAHMHHIVDPRSGLPATGPWRTATVAAPSALLANTASTAAIVLGPDVPAWLTGQGRAARLITHDGAVVTTPGWPQPERVAA